MTKKVVIGDLNNFWYFRQLADKPDLKTVQVALQANLALKGYNVEFNAEIPEGLLVLAGNSNDQVEVQRELFRVCALTAGKWSGDK